jgi:ribosomal protein S18 acetylase RimI-like enzyme
MVRCPGAAGDPAGWISSADGLSAFPAAHDGRRLDPDDFGLAGGGRMVRLKEPSEDQFRIWLSFSTRAQAAERARHWGTTAQDGLEDLETVIPRLLPDGAQTQGHLFRVILDDQDQEVGFVWAGPLPGLRQEQRFLFGTFVVPSCRGRGVGRAALGQALEELRAAGVREVTLEVAGDNAPARALGRILGYEELDKPSGTRSVLLRKTF